MGSGVLVEATVTSTVGEGESVCVGSEIGVAGSAVLVVTGDLEVSVDCGVMIRIPPIAS